MTNMDTREMMNFLVRSTAHSLGKSTMNTITDPSVMATSFEIDDLMEFVASENVRAYIAALVRNMETEDNDAVTEENIFDLIAEEGERVMNRYASHMTRSTSYSQAILEGLTAEAWGRTLNTVGQLKRARDKAREVAGVSKALDSKVWREV